MGNLDIGSHLDKLIYLEIIVLKDSKSGDWW